jgi:hypothetical protein
MAAAVCLAPVIECRPRPAGYDGTLAERWADAYWPRRKQTHYVKRFVYW